MPLQWTAEKDQRLLFVITDLVRLDYKAIAVEWRKRYGMASKTMVDLISDSDILQVMKRLTVQLRVQSRSISTSSSVRPVAKPP